MLSNPHYSVWINLDAAMDSWRSPVYDHYNISLRRDTTATGHPMSLVFVFECKFNQQDHPTLTRLRNKTSEGTGNLKKAMDVCLKSLGQSNHSQMASDTTNTLPSGQYTYATHRALIALRCAKNFRPFNMVTDSDYILEVLLLRPGTKIPDPSTVSRDIKHIYEQMALHVKNYFLVRLILYVKNPRRPWTDMYIFTEYWWACASSSGWLDFATHLRIPWTSDYLVCWWKYT